MGTVFLTAVAIMCPILETALLYAVGKMIDPSITVNGFIHGTGQERKESTK